jgi:hypothetical protein
MEKTIVIPTDFTFQSLNVLKTVLNENNKDIKYNVILLHGIDLSDSIRDLLFFSKSKLINSLTNIEFDEACEVIRNKFTSQMSGFKLDLFTGFTQTAFNNYLEANEVDEVYISNLSLGMPHKKSFDLIPYIQKSKVALFEVKLTTSGNIPEQGKLAEVFLNRVTAS